MYIEYSIVLIKITQHNHYIPTVACCDMKLTAIVNSAQSDLTL